MMMNRCNVLCLAVLLSVVVVDAIQLRRRTQTTEKENQTIVGGELADPFDYPWYTIFGDGKVCAGALISNNRVLTTAKCLEDGIPETVVVMTNTTMNGYSTTVQCGVKHPDFVEQSDPYTLRNDIAVLYLDGTANKVARPFINGDNNYPSVAGDFLVTMGFETKLFEHERKKIEPVRNMDKLTELKTSYRTVAACQAQYGDDVIYQFEHHCQKVTLGGAGSCRGDQGNPVLDRDDRLIGLQSFTYGCADDFYNVATNVASYFDWIQDRIRDIDCDTTAAPTAAPAPDCIFDGLLGVQQVRDKLLAPLNAAKEQVTSGVYGMVQSFRGQDDGDR